jgi:hypothetical protein
MFWSQNIEMNRDYKKKRVNTILIDFCLILKRER